MFMLVYSCFFYVYICLLVFTCLPMFTRVYICLPLFSSVFLYLPMFSRVDLGLPLFTRACLPRFTNV